MKDKDRAWWRWRLAEPKRPWWVFAWVATKAALNTVAGLLVWQLMHGGVF